MSCYPRVTSQKGSYQRGDEDLDPENKESPSRRSFKAPFYRKRDSSISAISLSSIAKQALFNKRRASVNNGTSTPESVQNGGSRRASGIFNIGKSKGNTRTASRTSISSGRALLRSAFGSIKTKKAESGLNGAYDGGSECKPILSFRGGSAWKYLEFDSEELHLDLFWPDKKETMSREDVMPLRQLAPLCNFRNLTSLKITGMLRSYQRYIWQAVWLNPNLETLELEMAIEPCIRRTFNAGWPSIKGDWAVLTAGESPSTYHGDNGRGVLERRIGIGEYLDKQAISRARNMASAMGCSLRRLPIVKLSLTGFVVDADPFFYWFNPHRLRMIDFKNDCVDAGFVLPTFMAEHVIVTWPQRLAEYAQYARVVSPGEVTLVKLGTKGRYGKEHDKETKKGPKKSPRRQFRKSILNPNNSNEGGNDERGTHRLSLSQSSAGYKRFSIGRPFWKN